MPLNDKGGGPEMDESRVSRMTYEVWDANLSTVMTFASQTDAELFAGDCNEIANPQPARNAGL
jgi:hypothetical protein